jgi:hypothetical protein
VSTDLQTRFEVALRRALSGSAEVGATTVHVASPDVHITPTVMATLPALDQPLQVLDVGRQNGAYEWRLTGIKRDDQGRIVDAQMTPERFIPLESFE